MDALAAILPSAGLLLLFVVLVRSLLHADRRERAADAAVRAEHRARTTGPERPADGGGPVP